MKVLGIVAEYNPFHNGHLYHLQKAVEAVVPDLTYIALSSCFTQRGDPAMFSTSIRTKSALLSGADAVFSLPVCWTLRDAEHYCSASVHLLADLGVTHLAFGAEEQNLSHLTAVAEFLNHPSTEMSELIRSVMAQGAGYPAALSYALDCCLPHCKGILNKPNNILAVNYLRAIERDDLSLQPVLIPRSSSYHDTRLDPLFPSATSVRNALTRGDWNALQCIPESVRPMIREAFLDRRIITDQSLQQALIYLFRSMKDNQFSSLPDLSEGIEFLLKKKIYAYSAPDDLIGSIAGKRYTEARIRRLLYSGLLEITEDILRMYPTVPEAILLGLRKESRLAPSRIPIISKVSEHDRTPVWFQIEERAYDLCSLAIGGAKGAFFTNGVCIV